MPLKTTVPHKAKKALADARTVYNVCTKGYEAKVINIVGFSILQVVLDLTILQIMMRVALMTSCGDMSEMHFHGEIRFTEENVKLLIFFFFTTVTGAVVAVYRCAIGTALLILTEFGMTILLYTQVSQPMIILTVKEFLEESETYPFCSHMWWTLYNHIYAVCAVILYAFPTALHIWFMYCTLMVTFVFLGYHVYDPEEVANSTLLPTLLSTTETSTIDDTERSTPAETDYFSDLSSNSN